MKGFDFYADNINVLLSQNDGVKNFIILDSRYPFIFRAYCMNMDI